MRAVQLPGSENSFEQLFYGECPEPIPEADDALIRVRGCAITKSELTWPEVHLAADGTNRPIVIPGHEISGVIETIPEGVSGLKVGDEIYALVDFCRVGGAAEFVAVNAAHLAKKPKNLNFIEAAAIPLAGLTAWQGLFEHAGLTKGDRLLIHGAAGGVGSYAVQFGHWAGALIIATGRGNDEQFLKELGADVVLDYEKVEFEREVKDVDVVFDTVGGETLDRSWQVLRPGGTLVTVHTPMPGEDPVAKAGERGVRGIMFIVKPDAVQLAEIARLIDEGEVSPIIDRVFPLSQTKAAFEALEGGPKRGKIVLEID